jgi:hypothetical protein
MAKNNIYALTFIAIALMVIFPQAKILANSVEVTATVDVPSLFVPGPGGGGVSHLVCNAQYQCVSINGAGTNECQTNSDCQHYACNLQNKCVVVGGAGKDLCQTDVNCLCDPHGDINKDGKINIVDFSILMYFWGQTNPSNPCADLNKDGIVNLTDFSIMLYWWTG